MRLIHTIRSVLISLLRPPALIYLLLILLMFSPMIAVLIGELLGHVFGFPVNAGSVVDHFFMGFNVGELAAYLFVSGWYIVLSIPAGMVLIVIYSLILDISSRRNRSKSKSMKDE